MITEIRDVEHLREILGEDETHWESKTEKLGVMVDERTFEPKVWFKVRETNEEYLATMKLQIPDKIGWEPPTLKVIK